MTRSRLGLAFGLAVLVVYLNFALGWVRLSQRLTLLLAFAIGPAAIFGIVGLCERLATVFPAFPTPPAEAGAVDLGPATIAWWVGVFFLNRRLEELTGEEGK